jgi:SRSO17 transposase
MIPLVGVPQTIAKQMSSYREVFFRAEGFEHISRYVSGLILSENKTLQGIYAQQVYPQTEGASRRAIHSAVFEAGWSSEQLMTRLRQIVEQQHRF